MSMHPSGDDRLLRECPYCAAPPDQWCLTASGEYSSQLHTTRGRSARADSGYRAFHNGCGGMIAFGLGSDGFCTACEDENVGFSDYTLVAVKPPDAGSGP